GDRTTTIVRKPKKITVLATAIQTLRWLASPPRIRSHRLPPPRGVRGSPGPRSGNSASGVGIGPAIRVPADQEKTGTLASVVSHFSCSCCRVPFDFKAAIAWLTQGTIEFPFANASP